MILFMALGWDSTSMLNLKLIENYGTIFLLKYYILSFGYCT